MAEDLASVPAPRNSSSPLSSTSSSSSVGMLPGAFPARALGTHLTRYAGALATSSKGSVLNSTPSNSSNASSTYWGVGSVSNSRKLGSFASRNESPAEQDAAVQQPKRAQLAGQSFKHQSSVTALQEASFVVTPARASGTGSCPCGTAQHIQNFATQSQPHSAEDAEVAVVTSGNGAAAAHSHQPHQQQQGLALLDHMELLVAHKTRDSGCTSAPPVLIPESSGSCTPCGRRSWNALELAAMAEVYTQPLMSPAGKQPQQQQSYIRPFSTAPVFAPTTPSFHFTNSSGSSLAQQLQQLSVASGNDATQPVQRVRQVQSALAARVPISGVVKQQLLVEPPSSPQLLPHTQNRNCALVSAVPDSLGGLDLDHALSQPFAQACPASPTGHSSAIAAAVQRGTRSARPSRIGMLEAALTDSAGADQHATAAVQHAPVVLVLPPSRPALHHSSSYLADVGQPRMMLHTEGPRVNASKLPGSAAAVAAAGGPEGQFSAAFRQISVSRSPGADAAHSAAITAANQGFELDVSRMRRSKSHSNISAITACQQQQQQQPRPVEGAHLHSANSMSSRSLSACRSRNLRNSPSRPPSHGCRSPSFNTTNTMNSCFTTSSSNNSNSSSTAAKPVVGAGARRSSTGADGRAREPVGPLELDPCAPPLQTAKLSKPDVVDVDYIVHRWSHRWQCDRERQHAHCSLTVPAAAVPYSTSQQYATGAPAGTCALVTAAGAAACSSGACSSPVWLRPPEELHLFGASSLDAIRQQQWQ